MERPKGMITTKQVQERYGVHRNTVLRWREEGLRYYTVNNYYVYFDPKDIKEFLKQNYTPVLVK